MHERRNAGWLVWNALINFYWTSMVALSVRCIPWSVPNNHYLFLLLSILCRSFHHYKDCVSVSLATFFVKTVGSKDKNRILYTINSEKTPLKYINTKVYSFNIKYSISYIPKNFPIQKYLG
jgi:hypothetical protein